MHGNFECGWDDGRHYSIPENQGKDHIDLVWRFQEDSPGRIRGPTRFMISPDHNAPFDAVLGRKDSIEHGLQKNRGRFR